MPIPLNPKRCYWAELSYPFGMFFDNTSKYILAIILINDIILNFVNPFYTLSTSVYELYQI